MTRTLLSALVPLLLAAALPAVAQDTKDASAAAPAEMTAEQKKMMEAYVEAGTPGAAHQQLIGMQGEYDLVMKSWDAPGAPPNVESGMATRKVMLEGRVMVEDVQASMHGQPFIGHGMQGFDNVTGKYWATWNDNMTTGLMVSEGTCDDKQTCTFTGSFNDPMTKEKMNARMTSRWTTPGIEVFEMFVPGPDGKEMMMMEITYTKRAK